MQVRPGELYETSYVARNRSERDIVGSATPSVAPTRASQYFNKTECFCFTAQTLAAGESRDMPVRFIVDPDLPADVKTLTLSYTFFKNDVLTARLSEPSGGASAAAPRSALRKRRMSPASSSARSSASSPSSLPSSTTATR